MIHRTISRSGRPVVNLQVVYRTVGGFVSQTPNLLVVAKDVRSSVCIIRNLRMYYEAMYSFVV